MSKKIDIVANKIIIQNDREISPIIDGDDVNYFSSLTVHGGAVFGKGVKLGMQDKMIPGMLFYDNENFYGFSEKHGLCLLSAHSEYQEIVLPESLFIKKQQENANNNSLSAIRLNIDLSFKDFPHVFLRIPDFYERVPSTLFFLIQLIVDMNSIISKIDFVIVNPTNKKCSFDFQNQNLFVQKPFIKELEPNSVMKLTIDFVPPYFIISQNIYARDY